MRDRTPDRTYVSEYKTHTRRREVCQKLTAGADQSKVNNRAMF